MQYPQEKKSEHCMVIRLSGPRCLAMSVAGAALGWWSNTSDVADMAKYSSLTREELLAELAANNDPVVWSDLMGGVIAILMIVLLVDTLTRFFEAAWARIAPAGSSDRDSGPANVTT